MLAEKNGTINSEAVAHARLALQAMTLVENTWYAIKKMQHSQVVTLARKRDYDDAFQKSSNEADPATKHGNMINGQQLYV